MKEEKAALQESENVSEPAGDKAAVKAKKAAGFRESNKADKRRRIRNAARRLFSRQGYDATTMRQIAKQAEVALGTLSLYARDKRDLVLLIFNENIPKVIDRAQKVAEQEEDFLEKLVTYFRVINEDFYANVTLTRIHLQLNYYSGGMHSAEYYANRQRLFDFVERAVREAQQAGRISTSEDPTFIARHFFFVYSAALRWSIASEKPDLEAGINDLRRLLRLQISGLAADGAGTSRKPRKLRQSSASGRTAKPSPARNGSRKPRRNPNSG